MRDYIYRVLYTPVLKMAEVRDALHGFLLQEGRGIAFCPCIEFWRRDKRQYIIKTLFPGYVFIRSDMDLGELHELVRQQREKSGIYIRELGLQEKRADGGLLYGSADDGVGWKMADLNAEESRFMDFLLELSQAEAVEGSAGGMPGGAVPGESLSGAAAARANASSSPFTAAGSGLGKAGSSRLGLLRKSAGYRENGRYYVMEGPLKAYEDRIYDVNRHERRAYLDLAINGNRVVAGFEARPKSYWFPEEKDSPEVLEDGTEINIREMAKKMMGG